MPSLDDLRFEEFNPKFFPEVKHIPGPSPYAHKPTEGPSYIKPEDRQEPLVASGLWKKEYGQHAKDVSPLLGVEYPEDIQIADFIDALLNPESTEEQKKHARNIIRDIAIEISRKGVVAFRNQHKLTVQKQKDFTNQLGVLTNKPKQNGLHIHPRAPSGGLIGEDGLIDPEVFYVSSTVDRRQHKILSKQPIFPSYGWHSGMSTHFDLPLTFTNQFQILLLSLFLLTTRPSRLLSSLMSNPVVIPFLLTAMLFTRDSLRSTESSWRVSQVVTHSLFLLLLARKATFVFTVSLAVPQKTLANPWRAHTQSSV